MIIKNIIAPLNLLSDYDNLLQYTVMAARKAEAHVTFVYADWNWLKGGTESFQPGDADFPSPLIKKIAGPTLKEKMSAVVKRLEKENISFSILLMHNIFTRGFVKLCNSGKYDLIMMGTGSSTIRRIVRGTIALKIMKRVNIPVFVVPAKSSFYEIQNITYAIDVNRYEPQAVQQLISIAKIFDANLTLVNVNTQGNQKSEQYLNALDSLISDTLDYPKIIYKFFDAHDIFAGLKQFVDINKTNVFAMEDDGTRPKTRFSEDKSIFGRLFGSLNIPMITIKKANPNEKEKTN